MERQLLTVIQAAERLCLSKHTIRQWVATRRIEHVRLGRAIRIPRAAVERALESGTVPERRLA